ncbi:MAG: hypothetical protein ACTHOK_15250, partial [Nocardioidaceae bacterium]
GKPWLRIGWRRPARVSRIRLALTPTAGASAPHRITLVAAGQRRKVLLDARGAGSFRPLRATGLTVRFGAVRPAYSLEAGGVTVRLPVGVSEVRLPQVAAVRAGPPGDRLRLPCGSGPSVRADVAVLRTRVQGTLRALLSDRPVPVGICGTNRLRLGAGPHDLLVDRTTVSVPERLVLQDEKSPAPAPVQVGPLRVLRWGGQHRAVQLPDRADPTLLFVNENLNPGWRADLRGRSLPAQRVDGWKQGWLVPAGAGGVVTMTYVPDRFYQAALAGGAAAALVVLVVAARGSSRDRRYGPLPAARGGWPNAVLLVAAGGLLAGAGGALVALVALVATRDRRLQEAAGWVAALLLLSAGLALALLRAQGTFPPHSSAAQGLALLALATALVGANGPLFFRRRQGRSSR